MRQLVVLSGKGGTGKTITAASLAHLASREMSVVLVDADVDAANLGLILSPTERERNEFRSGQVAVIDEAVCTRCNRCIEVCRFDAITVDGHYEVDPLDCEGCASCFYQCPAEAIAMQESLSGEWYRSDTRFGPLFHAHLYAGQENSGKLVTLVKQRGRLLGLDEGRDIVIIDGPPGIGCPVISACSGVDLALLVVEPTVSGIHDLQRVMATTDHFGVESLVVINKFDINLQQTEEISAYCAGRGVEVVGRVPYDEVVTQAMVDGRPVTEFSAGRVSHALLEVWARTKQHLLEKEITGDGYKSERTNPHEAVHRNRS